MQLTWFLCFDDPATVLVGGVYCWIPGGCNWPATNICCNSCSTSYWIRPRSSLLTHRWTILVFLTVEIQKKLKQTPFPYFVCRIVWICRNTDATEQDPHWADGCEHYYWPKQKKPTFREASTEAAVISTGVWPEANIDAVLGGGDRTRKTVATHVGKQRWRWSRTVVDL